MMTEVQTDPAASPRRSSRLHLVVGFIVLASAWSAALLAVRILLS